MINLALWGDSIGRAVGFNEALGRYAVLKPNYREILLESEVVDITNHARFGATLPEGLKDFEATPTVAAPAVAIQFGGNDCNLDWAAVAADPHLPHGPRTSLADFAGALRRFIRLVKAQGKIPILVTPPPLFAPRFVDWVSQGLDKAAILRFIGDEQHVYRWQERYAGAVHQVARLTRCRLFDLRDAFLADDDLPGCLCRDGMHPNEKGQRLIVRAVEQALSRLGLL